MTVSREPFSYKKSENFFLIVLTCAYLFQVSLATRTRLLQVQIKSKVNKYTEF